jgi:hypothetical protein
LEEPATLLRELLALGVPHVILDRTPFVAGGRDRLVVQFAPPELGGGRYPCWLFDRAGIAAVFSPTYALRREWRVEFDGMDGKVEYCGLHFSLNRNEGSRTESSVAARPAG